MAVYKDNRPTKDGKIWFFKTQYEDFDGTKKPKKSGRFATKKEAEQAELEFKISLHEKVNHSSKYYLTSKGRKITNSILLFKNIDLPNNYA